MHWHFYAAACRSLRFSSLYIETMTTTLAPNAGPMVQEDTPLTTQDTSRAPEATDTSAPPRKRLRRSKRQEKANGECEHDKESPFFTSETPPPLQKVVSAPILGSNTCDDGAGLRLIDVSSLASPLELIKSTMLANWWNTSLDLFVRERPRDIYKSYAISSTNSRRT